MCCCHLLIYLELQYINKHTQGAQIPVHSTQKSATSGRTSKPKPSRDTDKKLLFEGSISFTLYTSTRE